MTNKLSNLKIGDILTYSDGVYLYVVNVAFSGNAEAPLSYLIKRQPVSEMLKNSLEWEVLLNWTSDFELTEEKMQTIFPISDWTSKEDVLPTIMKDVLSNEQ